MQHDAIFRNMLKSAIRRTSAESMEADRQEALVAGPAPSS